MGEDGVDVVRDVASMRPPQNAGESVFKNGRQRQMRPRFNEAPAERGGKSPRRRRAADAGAASMRPPQNAGESDDLVPVASAHAALQ